MFLVTGATGFVGKVLTAELLKRSYSVVAGVRCLSTSLPAEVHQANIGDLDDETDWSVALKEIDTVIHLAARAHVMDEKSKDPLAEYRKVNVEGTRRLASMAADSGVKRFIFVSTIKVNGEFTFDDRFREDNEPNPQDPYAVSKLEAELLLKEISEKSDMEIVILRVPLVYGPGVKANFLRMIKIIKFGIPLPLASIKNKRSMIYVGNLVDALIICTTHPAAVGKTYLVSDSEDLSTPELTEKIAQAFGVPTRLFPVPVSIFRAVGRLTDKSAVVDRLVGSLTVDSSKIRNELNWIPPFSVSEGLRITAQYYENKKNF